MMFPLLLPTLLLFCSLVVWRKSKRALTLWIRLSEFIAVILSYVPWFEISKNSHEPNGDEFMLPILLFPIILMPFLLDLVAFVLKSTEAPSDDSR